VIGAVFGEWVGSDRGIGVYILQTNSRLQTDRVYAAIVVLASIGVLAFVLVAIWERLATPWRRRSTRRTWRLPSTPRPTQREATQK
jgi:ABC-type nitrate/sulfonate/bicarbonate transport system permease component